MLDSGDAAVWSVGLFEGASANKRMDSKRAMFMGWRGTKVLDYSVIDFLLQLGTSSRFIFRHKHS